VISQSSWITVEIATSVSRQPELCGGLRRRVGLFWYAAPHQFLLR
jgi:hypothetical protein